MKKDTTKTTDAISKIHFEGNIIPALWYQNLQHENKPYSAAIMVLSEIIYWYRNKIIKDERTGQVVEIKKKFWEDKLQKSYQQLSDYFGFSKRQIKDAVDYLKNNGLITIEFRTIKVKGVTLSNVLYIEPIPEKIEKITHEEVDFCRRGYVKMQEGVRKNVRRIQRILQRIHQRILYLWTLLTKSQI
jgi:hypothetical protein